MPGAPVNVNSLTQESKLYIKSDQTHSLIIPSITITDIDEENAGRVEAKADKITVTFNPEIKVLTFDKREPTLALAADIAQKIKKDAVIKDQYQILIKEAMDYLKLVSYEPLTITPDEKRELSFTVKDTIIKILDCELLQILYNMTKIIKRINPKKDSDLYKIKKKIADLKKTVKVTETQKLELLDKSSPKLQGNLIDLFTNITSIINELPDYGKQLDAALKKIKDGSIKYGLHTQLYNYFEECYKTILGIRIKFHSSKTANLTNLKLAVAGQLTPPEMKDVAKNSNALEGSYPDLATEITNFLTQETDTTNLDKYFYSPLAYVYNIIQNEDLDANEKENQNKAKILRTQLNTIKTQNEAGLTHITEIFDRIQASIKIPAITGSKQGGARKRTKRKKEKNNKVSQRKNKIKIKVKKHASRKARAKGKSKKGRKL
jgi:hypothetical protein